MKKTTIAKIVATWLVYYILVELPLMLIGFAVVAYLAHGMKWKTRESDLWPGRYILVWNTGAWAWLFGNEEDGIDGLPTSKGGTLEPRQQWWFDKTAKWTQPRRVLIWAGWRNSVSNLRFTVFGVKTDPQRVQSFQFNKHYDNGRPGEVQGIYERWWCWQGWRGRLHYETEKRVVEIGWKLRPEDAAGIPADDTRLPGAGFGLRMKRKTSG